MLRRRNSTFRIKPDAKPLQRGTKKMKRSAMKRSQKPVKKKREPPALIKWRRECRIRDDYRCQFPGCPVRSKRIDVHHIAKKSERPDLKFTVSNGVCLCRLHHDWTDAHLQEAIKLGLRNIETYELAKKQEREAA